MTDGHSNRTSTSSSPSQFPIDEAYLAKAADIAIMTIHVGARADRGLNSADCRHHRRQTFPTALWRKRGGAGPGFEADFRRVRFRPDLKAERNSMTFDSQSHPEPGRLPGEDVFRLIAR
jgi:hypothetical protein